MTKSPFFDTREVGRLNRADSILSYPYEYCLKESNLDWVNRACSVDDGLGRLVTIARDAQLELARHLPLCGSSMLWTQRDRWIKRLAPTTVLERRVLPKDAITQLGQALDTQIIEEVLAAIPMSAAGRLKEDAAKAAVACTWVAQHLALAVLGVAKAEVLASGGILLTPTNDAASQNLRRLWFGSAFDQMSLKYASANLELYAALASRMPGVSGDITEAFAGALEVFPQHWRLPADEGPVVSLAEAHLLPLLKLVALAIYAASKPGVKKPILRKDAQRNGFLEVYDAVLTDQSGRPVTDRVFDLFNGGLVLGSRQLAPGLMQIAEVFATQHLGAEWHDQALSDVQKRYIKSRLGKIAHVEVVDVVIGKDDTESKRTYVDVDFFVRDTRQGVLYAIQLKHLEYSDKGGIRYWCSRLRNRGNGLGKGIAQLEAITSLAKSDDKVRAKLIAAGIQSSELVSLVPVLLHNVGAMDGLVFQEGILLYDQHTFVNVLADRQATMAGAMNGHVVRMSIPGGGKPYRLDNPDSVIDAYISDPRFQQLSHFDAAADATRTLSVAGSRVVSRGLGL